MSPRKTRLWSLLAIEAMLVLLIAPVGLAQESPTVEVTAFPLTVSVRGEVVQYAVEVLIPDADLPATITSLTSDLHGDIADAANPLLVSTNCEAPVPYEPTPGWVGMGCIYEAFVEGDPGDVTNTISVGAQLADGSDVTLSDSVVVTISEGLGAIRGTLIDSGTGLPIPDTYVWGGDMEGFTDSSGMFFFDGLEPGDYRLYSGNADHGTSGVPPGYRSDYAYEYYDEDPVGVPAGWPNPGTPIPVLAGEITEIEWELTRGGVITGRVTSSDTGEAITDYRAMKWIIDNGAASPIAIGYFVADVSSDGAYRFVGLRAGDYIVCVESSFGNECWDDVPRTKVPPDGGDPVSVVLGQETSGIDFQFQTEVGDGTGGNGIGTDGGNGETDGGVLPFTGTDSIVVAILGLGLIAIGAGVLATQRLSSGEAGSVEG